MGWEEEERWRLMCLLVDKQGGNDLSDSICASCCELE